MNARSLINEGQWVKHDREWPHYQGEGPTYTEPTGRFEIRAYVTRTRSRKTRIWWVRLDDRPVSRFSTLTDALKFWKQAQESIT